MLTKHVPLYMPNSYWKRVSLISALSLDIHYKLQRNILRDKTQSPLEYLNLSTCRKFPRCTCLICLPQIHEMSSRYTKYYYYLNNYYHVADDLLMIFEDTYFNTASDENILSVLRKYFRAVEATKLRKYQSYAERIREELFDFMVQKKIYDGFSWISLLDIAFEYTLPLLDFLRSINCDILELVLKNIQDYFMNSNSSYEYEKFQRNFPATICGELKSIPLQSVLLKYGHEKFMFKKAYLLVRAMDYYCKQCSFIHEFSFQYRNLVPPTHTLERVYLLMQLFFVLKTSLDHGKILQKSSLDIWKAIPDPFATGDEIRTVFAAFVPANKHDLIDRVVSYYEEIFKKKDLQPRSLKHFSRCVIRKTLNARCLLPKGIAKLNVPSVIAAYLNLES